MKQDNRDIVKSHVCVCEGNGCIMAQKALPPTKAKKIKEAAKNT
jgi:hypothetical protein